MAGQVITKISASSGTHLISSTFYGTCATAAGTAAKAVIINDTNITDAITLVNGMTLAVKFVASNSVASPTITVYNNSGTAAEPTQGSTTLIAAKPIYQVNTNLNAAGTAASTSAATSWKAGAIVVFVYDGQGWVEASSTYNQDNNTTALTSMTGTLPVNKGGTGVTSNTVNAVLIGGTTTTGAIQNVAATSGALYSTGANVKPTFGILPRALGGTDYSGVTTVYDNNNITVYQWGPVTTIQLRGVSAQPTSTGVLLADVTDGISEGVVFNAPAYNISAPVSTALASENLFARVWVAASTGKVYLNLVDAVSAAKNWYGTLTYIGAISV